MDPQQYAGRKNKCTAVVRVFHFSTSNTYSYTYKSTVAQRNELDGTAIAREEGQGARWPDGQATTLEVRGGQATRRGASCYTQQRTFENLCCSFFLGFDCPTWCWLSGKRFRDCLPARATLNPEHAPRSPAATHTCAVVYTQARCVPRGREREKRPAAGREMNGHVQKKCISHVQGTR